jgi:tripeptidyl-peptidase-1
VYPDNDPNAASFGFPSSAQYKGQRQCGVYTPTNVISISYSLPEYLLPAFYMERQCNEWMKLGLQGVTVVVASGDQGVGENGNCQGPSFDIFTPYYISTCPYVLSVGATELNTPPGQKPIAGQKLSERATTGFGSGGGFSNVFPQPSYQSAAVQKYFSTVSLPFAGYSQTVNETQFDNITSGVYHTGGRGYPDVSCVGERILITDAGSWTVVAGTSAATPIWAAIITLINEARLAAGKATVGFINPILVGWPFPICKLWANCFVSTRTLRSSTTSPSAAIPAAPSMAFLPPPAGTLPQVLGKKF